MQGAGFRMRDGGGGNLLRVSNDCRDGTRLLGAPHDVDELPGSSRSFSMWLNRRFSRRFSRNDWREEETVRHSDRVGETVRQSGRNSERGARRTTLTNCPVQ